MPFFCSICGEESTSICVRCTKDACGNHLCERCHRCSDCCECEVHLDEPLHEPARIPLRPQVADEAEPPLTDEVAPETAHQAEPEVSHDALQGAAPDAPGSTDG